MDSTLVANLREMNHALLFPSQSSSTPSFPLVANYSSTRIYDSRYCWGRFWRWFYEILDYVTGTSWQQAKLQQAIIQTHRLFHQEMAKAQASLKEYMAYLEESGRGYDVEEGPIFSARQAITSWTMGVQPFLKIVQRSNKEQQILELAGNHLPAPSFACAETSLFYACQKVIDTEGMLAGPMPLFLIKKMIRKKMLTPVDQKEIKKWVHKMNKSDLDVQTLHPALKMVHSLFIKNNPSSRSFLTLEELELFLEAQGYSIFQKKDPKHLEWRHQIKPGKQILFPEGTVILGSKLPSQPFGNDLCAYSVEESPDLIALIAHNRSALALWDLKMAQQPDIGLTAARLKAISIDGRVALMERLRELSPFRGISLEGTISEKNSLLQILPELIKKYIQQNITPIPFSSASLMLDQEGNLKTILPVRIGPLDFNSLENLVAECSGNHPEVYKDLMHESGLDKHSIAKFYGDVKRQAQEEGGVSVEDLAAIYKITDPKVIDHAYLLAKRGSAASSNNPHHNQT